MVNKISARKEKYIQRALENGGAYTYDLANDEDLAQATENLGGIAHLKVHAPAVYEAFLNSRHDNEMADDGLTRYYADITTVEQQAEKRFVTENVGINCDVLPGIIIDTSLYDYYTNVVIASDLELMTDTNAMHLEIDGTGAIERGALIEFSTRQRSSFKPVIQR